MVFLWFDLLFRVTNRKVGVQRFIKNFGEIVFRLDWNLGGRRWTIDTLEPIRWSEETRGQKSILLTGENPILPCNRCRVVLWTVFRPRTTYNERGEGSSSPKLMTGSPTDSSCRRPLVKVCLYDRINGVGRTTTGVTPVPNKRNLLHDYRGFHQTNWLPETPDPVP